MRRAVRAVDFARSVSVRLAAPTQTNQATLPSTLSLNSPVRHVIGEDLFHVVLLRERRRVERSDEPFVLYVVEADTGARPRPVQLWRSTLDALATSTRATDVLGWFKQDDVIGVILTGPDAARAAQEFDARFRRELAK